MIISPYKTTPRGTALLPQTAQTPYFTVVNGLVRIFDIVGYVTVAIQDIDVNARLIANPAVGADVDLCINTNIRNDAIGTMLSLTGVLGDPITETVSGAFVAQASPTIVAPGTIDFYCSANATGQTRWTVRWCPIDSGAYIISA